MFLKASPVCTMPPDLIERVAVRLHWDMDRLDADPERKAWADMNNHEREYYRTCAEGMLGEVWLYCREMPATT